MKSLGTRARRFGLACWLLMASRGWAVDLIPFDANWIYLNPVSVDQDPAIATPSFNNRWFSQLFNPDDWSGPARGPFAWPSPDQGAHIDAFTEGNDNFVRPVGTFLQQPPEGERFSAYFRHDFVTTEPTDSLAIQMLADDGAVIYLDGQQIVFFNCCQFTPLGANPTFTELSLGGGNETNYSTFQIIGGLTLPAGNHTLAVQVVSASADSSDMGFSLRMFDGLDQEPLITSGEDWAYFRGTEEPSAGTLDWTTASFDDSTWDVGSDGFGYEASGVGGVLTGGLVQTVLEDMPGNYSTVYLRREFSVTDPSRYEFLAFDIDFDDGFVAYLNGQEIVRTVLDPDNNDATGIPFNVNGMDVGADHESTNGNGDAGIRFQIDLSPFPNLLKAGDNNVLAIQGINREPSSDFLLAQLQLFGATSGNNDGPRVPGDFNDDGQLTAADIDALTTALRNGAPAVRFDANQDGSVNQNDRNHWVISLKKTYFGDATMDGQFNTQDLVQVFQRGEFEDSLANNSTWADGDWNGDGEFTTADFVTAFQDGGFEQGLRTAVATVPEPSWWASSGIGLLATHLGWSRRAGRRGRAPASTL